MVGCDSGNQSDESILTTRTTPNQMPASTIKYSSRIPVLNKLARSELDKRDMNKTYWERLVL
jgi:hypothetical protein